MRVNVLAARQYLQDGPLVAFANWLKLLCKVRRICGSIVNPVISILIVIGGSQRD